MPNGSTGRDPAISSLRSLQCEVHSIAVQTANFEKAFDFYVRVLGLEILRIPYQFKTRRLAWLGAGAVQLELYSVRAGMTADSYDGNRVGPDHVAFVVGDLDAMVSHLKSHEVRILRGPLVPPSGDPKQPRILFVEGPDGDELQFREPDVED
jgi:catechol 2,3-dioxygenase-like lactoylglutathione lyase family enzyme